MPKPLSPNIDSLKRESRKLDLAWGDKIILNDGQAVQVIEAFDGVVKVVGGTRQYVLREEIAKHYPSNNPAYGAKISVSK
jgi:hypothetical protein